MANSKSLSICIAGAGIAGLTLALALAKHGVRVTVLERNEQLQEFGAGLQISPNARRALNALGLDEALHSVTFAPEGIQTFPFKRKKPITTLQLGQSATERFGVPYVVMHRADLAEVLYAATKRFANIDIRFNVEKFTVNQSDTAVSVTFSIGDRDPETQKFDALVGADGVSSHVRTELLGGEKAVYSGRVAWRTMIETEKLSGILSSAHTSLMWGPGYHAVAYPLPHRGQTNIALFSPEALSVAFGLHPRPTKPGAMLQDPRLGAIFGLEPDWTHWPLAAVRTPVWHQGRIALIGDAAHAMLPFQAQGAAMAIEDAVSIARLLVNTDNIEAAFAEYERLRQPRVNRVQDISASNGRIFHMRAPLSLARDAVVRLQGPKSHFARLGWIYDHDPTAG